MDTRKISAIEAILNAVISFIIYYFILSHFGVSKSYGSLLAISITMISVTRIYLIRRLFNYLTGRKK